MSFLSYNKKIIKIFVIFFTFKIIIYIIKILFSKFYTITLNFYLLIKFTFFLYK